MKRSSWWLVCLCLLVLTGVASAQVDQGAITWNRDGQYGRDPPGCSGDALRHDTGLTLQTKSKSSGNYTFSSIKTGSYTVSATASGFQTTTRQSVHVDAQQRLQVNLDLGPDQVSQTVTVSGAVALLQTQSSAVGQVIDTKTINETPLNGTGHTPRN